MNQQLLNDISKYVEDHIGEFHEVVDESQLLIEAEEPNNSYMQLRFYNIGK